MKNTVVNLGLMVQILHDDDVVLSIDEIVSFLDSQLQGVSGWEGLIKPENIIQTETFDIEVQDS